MLVASLWAGCRCLGVAEVGWLSVELNANGSTVMIKTTGENTADPG